MARGAGLGLLVLSTLLAVAGAQIQGGGGGQLGGAAEQKIIQNVDRMQRSETAARAAQAAAAGAVAKVGMAVKDGRALPEDGIFQGDIRAPSSMGGWKLPTEAVNKALGGDKCYESCHISCRGVCPGLSPPDKAPKCGRICGNLCEEGCFDEEDLDAEDGGEKKPITMEECIPACISECAPECMKEAKNEKDCATECNEFCDTDCKDEIAGNFDVDEDEEDETGDDADEGGEEDEDEGNPDMDDEDEDGEDDDEEDEEDGGSGRKKLDSRVLGPQGCEPHCVHECRKECVNDGRMTGAQCDTRCFNDCKKYCAPLHSGGYTDGDQLLRASERRHTYVGGNPALEWLTYIMVFLVIAAAGFLAYKKYFRDGMGSMGYFRVPNFV